MATEPGFVRPEWESDESSPSCTACAKGFKLTRRRHHCRGCGRVFCHDCSSKKHELPAEFQLKGPQRVCDNCYFALVQARVEENPDEHPPKPDYKAVEGALKEKLASLSSEPEESWVKKTDKDGVKVFVKKLDSSSLFCVKTTVTVPCTVGKVWGIYNQKELWKNWQPDMTECRTIEEISETAEAVYIRIKLPVIANRDSLVFTRYILDGGTPGTKVPPGSRAIMSTSIDHPLVPKAKKYVRAHIGMTSTTFQPISTDAGEHTLIESIVHTNPKGLIPPAVVNKGLSRAVDSIANMSKFMQASDYTPPQPQQKHAAL